MGNSAYNTTERDEAIRRSLTPWQVSLGLPLESPEEGLSWTLNTDNKIVIASVAPTGLPNGFELFETLEGASIRFIGSGLGSGDTGSFRVSAALSVAVNTGTGRCVFKLKTRPYTETVFANATLIPYLHVERDFANNDLGAMAFPSQIVTLNDGDLVEFSANPVSTFGDNDITSAGITIIQVN